MVLHSIMLMLIRFARITSTPKEEFQRLAFTKEEVKLYENKEAAQLT